MARRSRVVNRERIQQKLLALPEEMTAPIKGQIAAAGGTILRSAKRRAPKLTGTLKISITSQIEKQGLAVVIAARAMRGKFNYAWFAEFGTVKMPARPFLFPAFRASRKRTLRKVGGEVRRILGIVARRR